MLMIYYALVVPEPQGITVTWSKPDPCMLVWLGIFHVLWIYNLYRFWFHTEEEYEKNREQMIGMPSWMPLRERFVQNANDREKWSQQTKLTGILGSLFLIVLDTLLVFATILGE